MITVSPFRGEERSHARGAYLQLGTVDDERAALRMPDGRAGTGGEKLQVGLNRLPAVHPNRVWWWAYEAQEREKGHKGGGEKGGGARGEAYFEDETMSGRGLGLERAGRIVSSRFVLSDQGISQGRIIHLRCIEVAEVL